MSMELRPLTRRLSLQKTEIGGAGAYRGRLDDTEVIALVTGMGTRLACAGTERLLNAVSVDLVLVVGITGAVDHSTPIGTLVRPDFVVNGSTGARYRPAQLGDGARQGALWTSDELVTEEGVLQRLRSEGVVA